MPRFVENSGFLEFAAVVPDDKSVFGAVLLHPRLFVFPHVDGLGVCGENFEVDRISGVMLAVARLRDEIFVRGANRVVIQLCLFVCGAVSARQDDAVFIGGGAERFGIGRDQGGKHVPHIGDDFAADLHIGIVEDEKRVVSRCAVKSGKFGGDRVGLRIDVFKIDEDQLARGYLGGGNALLYVALVPCLDDGDFRSCASVPDVPTALATASPYQ